MSAAEDDTLAHYQASVPYYTLAFDASHSRHLDRFLDRLDAGAEILELGCGTGRDAARMIERGFVVDATDGTPAMLRKAKERHDVDARLMRFRELDAENRYDAVWAHACLFHVERNDLPDIVSRICAALKPEGLHYASYKLGDSDGYDDRGRWNSHLAPDFLHGVYCETGFDIVSMEPWQGKGADGVIRDWLSITAARP